MPSSSEAQLLGRDIPTLDFRSLDQDELLGLSAGYVHEEFRPVSPSIDRSIFNESTSSRRQTFRAVYDDPACSETGVYSCAVNRSDDGAWRESKASQSSASPALSEKILEMPGAWISSSEGHEKTVAAKGFPEGWTVLVRLREHRGRCYLDFRNYSSPDGRSWPSFKAASRFIMDSFRRMVHGSRKRQASTASEGANGRKASMDSESGTEASSDSSETRKRKKAKLARAGSMVGETQETENNGAVKDRNGEAPKEDGHNVRSTEDADDVLIVDLEDSPQVDQVSGANEKDAPQDVAAADTTPQGGGSKAPNTDNVASAAGDIVTPPPTSGNEVGRFECESCGKVFQLKKQYWGHQGTHARGKGRRSRGVAGTVPVEILEKEKEEPVDELKEEKPDGCHGWLDEGCEDCRCPVLDRELCVCSWCEKEFHLTCVGKNVGDILPADWTCPSCIPFYADERVEGKPDSFRV